MSITPSELFVVLLAQTYLKQRSLNMPGFILHMAAAKMLFEKLKKARISPDEDFLDWNAFQVGNLIPDSVTDKTFSHFRHPDRKEKLMVYPDLDLFLDKYRQLLTDNSCLGYYYHLFIDRVYAKDYIPQIITFYDMNGQEADNRADITHALIKRTGELVPIKTIFSDEYFTKMNNYLMNRFDLSPDIVCDVMNPGITEVNYDDIVKIKKQLQDYLHVSEEAVNELKVFDVEEFIQFLGRAAEQFVSSILI